MSRQSPERRPRRGGKEAPANSLTTRQVRYLRALGHHLQPVVQLGRGGASSTVVAAIDQALDDHELIKVRLGKNEPAARNLLANEIATKTRAHVAQVLGHIALLYRAHAQNPSIDLPR